jgi:hypothetical protein
MRAKGVWQVLWPGLNRAERGGGAASWRQWPSMAIGLDSQSRGGLRGETAGLMGGNEGRLHC